MVFFFNSTTYRTEKKSSKNSVIQLFKYVSPKAFKNRLLVAVVFFTMAETMQTPIHSTRSRYWTYNCWCRSSTGFLWNVYWELFLLKSENKCLLSQAVQGDIYCVLKCYSFNWDPANKLCNLCAVRIISLYMYI